MTYSKSSKREREDLLKIQQEREREELLKIQQEREREELLKSQQPKVEGKARRRRV